MPRTVIPCYIFKLILTRYPYRRSRLNLSVLSVIYHRSQLPNRPKTSGGHPMATRWLTSYRSDRPWDRESGGLGTQTEKRRNQEIDRVVIGHRSNGDQQEEHKETDRRTEYDKIWRDWK